ncbi:phosphoglycerate mutase family protein [Aaosphaeria arxii CBS 175.79]|uniref:Phosphoglycerate mutase family protein n=1 Tax=Aaosphaeria arxii CBS 175.79 TaxID=1450172 RepID=A0A6A5X7V6_9PLEO|nr:phosphoglycerate mutase family protein [Aaosphaeria arxii CBS 175.79]KAF2008897.1 phosphoglycerate mutase family protein [Aaosphaeria arxii CBS 175.79]
MGKPRMIILVRHAQSEGNKNRDIHQFIPDHRVKLTPHGQSQAEEAGRQLRSLLKPDDTLQFFTSPYRRTRETTEGILKTLTSDDPTPSPFPRHKIKVFEEPRLREQDFGNFQPCSAEMERMWQERADYGHFFYRIPHGESAADAYDRISGFNESMWRQFGEEDFPSVCVLVTHGLMTRVFLMKWYHWSVEYFEDLRNVNHCEFIVMKQNPTNGKYILQNELRTWSELKRRAAAANPTGQTPISSTPSKGLPAPGVLHSSPTIPVRRWGGCATGCTHDKMNWPRRAMRKNTADYMGGTLPAPALPSGIIEDEKDDHPIASQEAEHTPTIAEPTPSKLSRKPSTKTIPGPAMPLTPASPNDASDDSFTSDDAAGSSDGDKATASVPRTQQNPAPRTAAIMRHLHPPPGVARTRASGDGFSDDSDYFPGMQHAHAYSSPSKTTNGNHGRSRLRASSKHRQQSKETKLARRMSEKNWMEEGGLGSGARADTLGDGNETGNETCSADRTDSPATNNHSEKPILREALKGDMIVENGEDESEDGSDKLAMLAAQHKVGEKDIERFKEEDRKGFSEIY